MGNIRTARIYDPAEPNTYRVLVDRLWPRGVTRERAALDEWNKDVAPSAGLRKEFGHVMENYSSFTTAYEAELAQQTEALNHLRSVVAEGNDVVLLYAAKDREVNHAVVLKRVLEES